MTPRGFRVTRLGPVWLLLVAMAALLGLVVGRAELFVAIAPLALALLRGTRLAAEPRAALTQTVSSARLFEGERLTVSLELTAETPLAQVEVAQALPPSAVLASGSARTVLALPAGGTARWSYELELPVAARAVIEAPALRAWQPSGLGVRDLETGMASAVRVYPRAEPVRRPPRPLRTQASVGNYVSPHFGDGIEPGEIRPFAPGDQIRHVNWRASTRLGSLFVTRYQQERNADVVLMLDTLSQAGAGATSTLHASLRATASLAAAYLARKDRVGLIEYGGVLRWVRPGSGRLAFERLLETLVRASVTFTFVAKSLDAVPPRILPAQALCIAVSPLLDARFIAAARDLVGRGFDVVVLVVDPVAATRAALAPSAVVDTACRLWAVERRLHVAALRASGLRVVEWSPDEPLELALSRLPHHARARAMVAS